MVTPRSRTVSPRASVRRKHMLQETLLGFQFHHENCRNAFHIEVPVLDSTKLLCSFSFARPKENEPKVPVYGMPYSGKKDIPRKFFTSRAHPSADDFVSPACCPTSPTKSFAASADGTEFSQRVISFCAQANRNRWRMWDGRVERL
jgi:hypothetical protein